MAAFLGTQPSLFAQVQVDSIITEAKVREIISYLASDSLKGRGNGRPELLKSALFIGEHFKNADLELWNGQARYYLPFRPFGGSKKATGDQLLWNDSLIPKEEFIYWSKLPGIYPEKKLSDFKVLTIDQFLLMSIKDSLDNDSSSLLIWTDHKQEDGKTIFPANIKKPSAITRDILFVYSNEAPVRLSLTSNSSYYNAVEYNVVGMLKGKTRPEEIVIFSAHYDHEGVYKAGRKDSIMNGANDDASGTTAVLMLAKYFSLRNDNDRTLLFCAFAGEELGLKGSEDFMNYIDSEKIVADINVEMIGIAQYGKSKAFIPGYFESSLPALLKKGLNEAGIRIIPEPNQKKLLFQRSDNFNFARKHIPAHTIMTRDDDDPCYHQPCDELKRIDIANMTSIIRGIAIAVKTLVNGSITPGRIRRNFEE